MPGSSHRFADALVDNPAPRRLGDLRFSYEPGRLMGVSDAPPLLTRAAAPALAAVSAGTALGCAWALAHAGGAALPLAGLSAAAGALAFWLDGRALRRRFVLHFATEQLRLEWLGRSHRHGSSVMVPFDDVLDVEAVTHASGELSLFVVYALEEGRIAERALLATRIPASQGDELHRIWRMLQNAFGLRPPAPDET